jgi:hypothetical protein
MTYRLVFSGNCYLATQYLNCKTELSELWWGLEIESCAENILKN